MRQNCRGDNPRYAYAYNDITAAKVLSELHALGVQVPEQAAVIGVDNDPDICENTRPPLSSVDPDFEAAGRMAVEVLSAALSERRRIPILKFGVSGVVERRSTQSGKTGSLMVSEAREILRRRYGERLSLELIAGELNISPRLLSLRFREITGGTVSTQNLRRSAWRPRGGCSSRARCRSRPSPRTAAFRRSRTSTAATAAATALPLAAHKVAGSCLIGFW